MQFWVSADIYENDEIHNIVLQNLDQSSHDDFSIVK